MGYSPQVTKSWTQLKRVNLAHAQPHEGSVTESGDPGRALL